MSLPVLEAFLARNYRVVVCARPWARTLLSGYALEDFIPISGQHLADAKAVRLHRKSHPYSAANTLALSLPDSLSSAFVFRWAGLKTAGYKDDGRRLLLKWPINKPSPHCHAVESWYYLAYEASKKWGKAIASKPMKALHLAGVPEANPEKFALDSKKTNILIAPTAVGLHKGQIKVWPHFEALTQALLQQGMAVYMCPPPNEITQAEQNAPSATRIAPLGLTEFAQLCKSVDWVICNDSGVSHLAAAVGAKQLTLIGVTDSTRTGPWSDQAHCLGENGHWPTLKEVLGHFNEPN